jgi:hypothetical protein
MQHTLVLIMAIMCNNLSPQSLIQGLGWKPNSVITNNPCKNKDHPQSGESNWRPLQWLLFQQSLRWIWWQWGSHHIQADSWEGRVEYQEACWWAKCNGQFLTVETEMKPLLFLLYIMLNRFGYLAHTQLCSSVQTVFQVCMDFYHLRMFLVIYYKYLHNIIHLNSGVTWLLLHTPFQPLSLNVWPEILLASSSIIVW